MTTLPEFVIDCLNGWVVFLVIIFGLGMIVPNLIAAEGVFKPLAGITVFSACVYTITDRMAFILR